MAATILEYCTPEGSPKGDTDPQSRYYIVSEIMSEMGCSALEVLLAGKIVNFIRTGKHRYCFATNGYFARLYNVSEQTIRRAMRSLEKRQLIECKVVKARGGKSSHIHVLPNLWDLMPPREADKPINQCDLPTEVGPDPFD